MHALEIQRLTGRTAYTGEECYQYFGGTAYLGIPYNPTFKLALKKGIQLFGTNYGSSRRGNIALSVYQETEHLFCDYLSLDGAITFSSGYMAAQAMVAWSNEHKATVLKINGDHPALWFGHHDPSRDSPALSYHRSSALVEYLNAGQNDEYIIMSTSVNPILGVVYDFDWVHQIRRKTVLVIDDSHGMGILGSQGNGIIDRIPRNPLVRLVIVASLGKALGVPGGILVGDSGIIQSIRSSPLYSSSSPVSPAYLCAFLYCQSLYSEQREKLADNMQFFGHHIGNWTAWLGEHPVVALSDGAVEGPQQRVHKPSLFDFLLKKKILISAFAYPSSTDLVTTRLVINATHTRKDLQGLAQQVDAWTKLPGSNPTAKAFPDI